MTRVAEALEREGRARVRWVARARPTGVLDLEDLERALGEGGVRLVAVQAVNAETGVIQPVARGRSRRHAAPGRACTSTPCRPSGASRTWRPEADTRSLAAHKIRGPKSIGALITTPGARASRPVLLGGSQERGVRPGTTDPVAAAGLAAAARHALCRPRRDGRRSVPCATRSRRGSCASLPAPASTEPVPRGCPTSTNVAFPGWNGPELVAALDLEGVAVSAGSACSAGTAEPSAVLVAMGDAEAATSSVRFSLGEETTEEDIDRALTAAERVLKR